MITKEIEDDLHWRSAKISRLRVVYSQKHFAKQERFASNCDKTKTWHLFNIYLLYTTEKVNTYKRKKACICNK